jgi:1-acyl-sn-glycerol-3-phosphate acyltransferase
MAIARSIFAWFAGGVIILLLFPLTCLIWLLTYPFDPERRLVHRWVLLQGTLLVKSMPFWSLKIEGREKIIKGETYVIISNHQSLLDIILITRLGNNFRWVSKAELFRVPILGQTMRMARYLEVARGSKESVLKFMDQALQTLDRNISVMMFPEGSRSKSTEIVRFKSGAFQLALRRDKPILPVVIDGTGKVLPKEGYTIKGRTRLRLKVLDPVYPGSFGSGDPDELATEIRSLMVKELAAIRKEESAGS